MSSLEGFLLSLPIFIFSIVAHEYAHGYAAFKQGDMTAYQLGRLTWNPVKHLDPFFSLLMPAVLWMSSSGSFVLGGAKPVPVVPRNYRNFKRGDIIVSLAGVAANAVIAVACMILVVVLGMVAGVWPSAASSFQLGQVMLVQGIKINLVLIMFNLMPIPPLDGSHVMKYLLPPAWSMQYQRLGMYGIFILIALLWIGSPILSVWMTPAIAVFNAMLRIVAPYLTSIES